MKAYGKKAKQRRMVNEINRELEDYIEMLDLNNLIELHETRGFGKKRLYEHLYGMAKRHVDNEHKYLCRDDKETLGIRGDSLVLKKRLMEAGFDYDAACDQILRDIMKYEKETYGGPTKQ